MTIFFNFFPEDPKKLLRHPIFWDEHKWVNFIVASHSVVSKILHGGETKMVHMPESSKKILSVVNKIHTEKWLKSFPITEEMFNEEKEKNKLDMFDKVNEVKKETLDMVDEEIKKKKVR